MTQNKKLLLVFNPKAGREEFRLNLFEVVDRFTKGGCEVTVVPTQSKGHAAEIVRERARDFDLLVCSGGDGTLSEALGALMECTSRPLFGYIPSGTTNDFAHTLGLPTDILQAADVVVSGRGVPIDVGRFGDRYFSYVAAFGLFTDVPYATPQDIKNVLGHAAYMLEGVKRLGSIHSYHCRVELEGEEIEGDFLLGMITNATSLGGFRIPAEQSAQLDDGLFEVILVRKPTSLSDLHYIAAKLLNWDNSETEAILMCRASSLRLESAEELHWTLDGEYGGATTSVSIANCHRAVEILVPAEGLE